MPNKPPSIPSTWRKTGKRNTLPINFITKRTNISKIKNKMTVSSNCSSHIIAGEIKSAVAGAALFPAACKLCSICDEVIPWLLSVLLKKPGKFATTCAAFSGKDANASLERTSYQFLNLQKKSHRNIAKLCFLSLLFANHVHGKCKNIIFLPSPFLAKSW